MSVAKMRTLVCLAVLIAIVAAVPIKINPKEDWWTHAVFYQIYPLSYKDTNQDGYGDLEGITEKLDYLKDLGIDGVWLSPIYPTPLADFTYDISNYRDIDPIFGSLEIFDKFVARAKELGIRVIMDYVPDYTSDENEWFVKSVQKEEPYTDYYTWDDGKQNEAGKRIPPNGWQSVFGGDAWGWNEDRQQWFLHQFTPKQPDLNWSNPFVVEDMKNVMRYWLDKNIDGFRVDAVPWLFEGPLDNNDTYSPQNLPETYNAVKIWRSVADEKSEEYGEAKILMLEVYGSEDQVMAYYGTPESPGGHFTFNFRFITDLKNTSNARNFSSVLNNYLEHVSQSDDRVPNWVLGNHDQHRVADRFHPKLVEGMHFLSLLLPGVALTFNGEEIGMLDTYITWEQCLDPQGVNAGPEGYFEHTRDLERTPFQWDDTTNAGFSEGNKTWLPVNPNYKELNAEAELAAEKSHIKVYKQLIQLRKEPTFKNGDTEMEALSDYVLAFTRTLENYDTYVIVLNLGEEAETVNLQETFSYLPDQLILVAASIYSDKNIGGVQDATSLELQPKDAFVFKSGN